MSIIHKTGARMVAALTCAVLVALLVACTFPAPASSASLVEVKQAPSVSASLSSTEQAFVDGVRRIFPRSVEVGTSDETLLEGGMEMCAGIEDRGALGYAQYLIQGAADDETQNRLWQLAELAEQTLCADPR